MSTFLIVLDIILAVILLVFLGFWAYNRIQAKRFGGEASGSFVNGILGKLANE